VHCDQHYFTRNATATPVFDALDDSQWPPARRRVFICLEAATLEALNAWLQLHEL